MQVSQAAELLRTITFSVEVGPAQALHLRGWQCGTMAEAAQLVAGADSAKGLQGEPHHYASYKPAPSWGNHPPSRYKMGIPVPFTLAAG